MGKSEIDIDWGRTALFLKIGIMGACIILAGDMLMGWGVRDASVTGIEGQISQYLTISDGRMFLASFFGLLGVPLAVVGHFAIYKMVKPYSEKYARLYITGILGFLAFGGAGVHVSSVEAAFFYKHMNEVSQSTALEDTIRFVSLFLIPMYVIMIASWVVMVYAHIRAVSGSLSPYPRWCWILSMLVGTLLFSIAGIFGNHAIVNALMVGAFSLGNIRSLSGHLIMLNRARINLENQLMHL